VKKLLKNVYADIGDDSKGTKYNGRHGKTHKKETTANDLYHNSTKRLIWLSTTRENVVQKWREK